MSQLTPLPKRGLPEKNPEMLPSACEMSKQAGHNFLTTFQLCNQNKSEICGRECRNCTDCVGREHLGREKGWKAMAGAITEAATGVVLWHSRVTNKQMNVLLIGVALASNVDGHHKGSEHE